MRPRAPIIALLLPIAIGLSAADSAGQSPAPLAIRDVTLIDGTGGPPLPGATVLLRDGRIAAVGPAAELPIPSDASVVVGSGKYLIPGLWDMHTHLSKARSPASLRVVTCA